MNRHETILKFLKTRFPKYNDNTLNSFTMWLIDVSLDLDDLSKFHKILWRSIVQYNELLEPTFNEIKFTRWLMLGGDLPEPSGESMEILDGKFEPHEFLGKGTYGSVISGKYGDNQVAMKQFTDIHRSTAPRHHDTWYTFAKEYAILHLLNEKCGDIVGKIHGVGWYKDTWGMIMELHDIKSIAFRSHELYTTDSMKDVIRQLFRAVDTIHTQISRVHGDIKPDNVMIDFRDVNGVMSPLVKIIDFGLSQPIGIIIENQQYIDTIFWRAPELLAEEECDLVPTDVWATAITAIDIMIGTYSIHLLGAKNDMEPGEIYGILMEYCLDDDVRIPKKWTRYIHANLLDFASDIFERYIVFSDKRATLKDLC